MWPTPVFRPYTGSPETSARSTTSRLAAIVARASGANSIRAPAAISTTSSMTIGPAVMVTGAPARGAAGRAACEGPARRRHDGLSAPGPRPRRPTQSASPRSAISWRAASVLAMSSMPSARRTPAVRSNWMFV